MALSAEFGALQAAERAEAEAFIATNAFGWTMAITNRDGSVSYLDNIRHGQPRYIAPFNLNAARATRTDALWPGGASGLALDGAGGETALWEISDPRLTHVEFTTNGTSGRRLFDLDGPSNRPGNENHATHVAGTLGALGVHGPAKGMAFRSSRILASDQEDDLSEMPAFFAANGFQISNHSYGFPYGWGTFEGNPIWWGDLAISATEDYHFGLYDDKALCIDRIAHECTHYLPVWAAGNERGPDGKPYPPWVGWHWTFSNSVPVRQWGFGRPDDGGTDGYDTLSSFSLAKNALVVGAVDVQLAMSSFGSYGPADDGRIGIDVCGMGVDVRSTGSYYDRYYYTGSGTSFASPNVAGSLALVAQLHERLAGRRPLSSTLRGLAIHTAREAGDHPGPDYHFGWGVFDARGAAELVAANFRNAISFIKELFIPAAGGTVKFSVIAVGGEPLKATLAWTDPPPAALPPQRALDPTNAVLVNDFDLQLLSPDGGTNLAWTLDPAAPAAPARKAGNRVDNVEQVVIDRPASNALHVLIISHKGTLAEGQWLSVLISGIVPPPEPVLKIRQIMRTGADSVALVWPAIPGRVYEVQRRDALDSGDWLPASGAISALRTNVAAIVAGGVADARFYRVVRLR